MLIKFLPEQVAKHWHKIKEAVVLGSADSVKIDETEKLNNILDKILVGSMICWISVDSKTNQIDGVITTTFLEDDISGEKNVLIYSLTSIGNSNMDSWKEGLQTIQKYTKSIGCKRLIAYSKDPLICRFVESIGGSCDFRILELPLL